MVSARAIRAGRANVELGLDDSLFQRQLRGIGSDLQNVGKKLAIGGAALTGFGTAILAPLGKAVKDFAAIGDQLDDMSARTGVAVEQLSALKFAAEQSGASLEAVEKGLKGQARFIVDASRGLATQTEVLEQLGLSYEQLKDLDPATLFRTLAVAISKVEGETMKAGLSMKVFGRAGTDLLGLFNTGADGIEALLQEAEDLGIVMSTEAAAAAGAFNDELNRLGKTFEVIKLEIGSALAPILTEFSGKTLRPLVKDVVEWVKENADLVIALSKFGAAVIAVGAPLTALGIALGAIGTTFKAVVGSISIGIAVTKAAIGAFAWLTKTSVATTASVASTGTAATATSASFVVMSAAAAQLNAQLLALNGTMIVMRGGFASASAGAITMQGHFLTSSVAATTLTGKLAVLGRTAAWTAAMLAFADAGIRMANPSQVGGGRTNKTPGMQESRGEARLRDMLQGKGEFAKPEEEPKNNKRRPDIAQNFANLGRNLKLEFEIKKSQVARGLNIGKQWAEEFWDGMEEERQRRESLFEQIGAKQEQIANQEQAIATARDNANLITGSAAAGVAGLGTNSVDQRQLDELEKLNAEMAKLRKELGGDS